MADYIEKEMQDRTNCDAGVWAEQRMMSLKLFQGRDPLSRKTSH